jgi:hypothetical protein
MYHRTALLKKPRTEENRHKLDVLEQFGYGQELGLRDLGSAFSRCEEQVFASSHDEVSSLIVHFKKLPSILTVGSFIPHSDYNGQRFLGLQDLSRICEGVSFNILVAEGHAIVAFLWFKGDKEIERFVRSYLAQRSDRYSTLAIQTSFEHIENTCIAIPWWEGLKGIHRKALLHRMHFACSPMEEPSLHGLMYPGFGFDEWEYDRCDWLNANT